MWHAFWNVCHAFWKFQKAKKFLEFNAFFSAQKWMCGMLFENSKKQKFLLKFTHFFQLKNECVACFLKNRPCVTCFLVMLFEKSSMCDMLFEKKSSMCDMLFEKARNFLCFFIFYNSIFFLSGRSTPPLCMWKIISLTYLKYTSWIITP